MQKTLMKLAAIVALALVAAGFTGCAAVNDAVKPANVQQFEAQVARACQVVQPTLMAVQAMTAADPAQAAVLAEVVKVNGAVCAQAASGVSFASVQDAVTATIPQAIKAISVLPIDQMKKEQVQFGLAVFQVALSSALAVYGPAPAAPAAAAVLPAPAASAAK